VDDIAGAISVRIAHQFPFPILFPTWANLTAHGWETFRKRRSSPPQGVYCQLAVYGTDCTMRDLDPCLSMAMDFDKQALADVVSVIPAEWIKGMCCK
jgi:hypothetical protein